MTFEIPKNPVPLWRLFLRMGGWFVIAGGVLLLVFTLASHFSLKTAKRFEAEGRSVVGVVTDKYTTQSRDSDGNTKTSYWLEFDFVTHAGEQVSLKRSVGSSMYRERQVGGDLKVLYLPSDPRKIELKPGSNRSLSRGMQIAAFVFGVAWLIGVWVVGGWAVSAVRARRYGTREVVKVTDIKSTNVRVNRKYLYRLTWQDAKGREGQSLMRKADTLSGFRRGSEIAVYQGVKRAWWEGDVGKRE